MIENEYYKLPLVSIVIPSYNCAQWVSEAIESILIQTYPNIEIIVIDDCSTDNTYEIISKFTNIKYFKNKINMGECYTSCRGFEKASGDYICRLSADDIYINHNKIKHQVEIMQRTNADWSYNSINYEGEILKSSRRVNSIWMPLPITFCRNTFLLFDNFFLKFPYFIFIRMFFRNPVNSSTIMFKKTSYEKSIKWSNGKHRTDCDGVLLYDMFLKRFKCISICESGAFYRMHPHQMSYASDYRSVVKEVKLEAINNVLIGKYPLWFKFAVKIVRRLL